MQPFLEIQDICLSYHSISGETEALSHISFSVNPSQFVAIVGPSGCGKSTLLNLISGLMKPDRGSILIEGRDAASHPATVGYMLQKDQLLEWRSIYQNVILGLEIRHECTPERLGKVDALLETYGLSRFRDSRPSELSGGMRQRAALIRTLALEPDFLLLDEPFSALDYQTRLNVGDDIGRILRKESRTAILVTHNIAEAISMADLVIVLTKRPATVQKQISINLEIPDRTPLSSRNAPNFKYYFNLIWKELNEHGADVRQTTTIPEKAEA